MTTTETHALPIRKAIDPVAAGLIVGFLLCLALAALEINKLAGLPAHPLLLHVSVVLIPILSGATIALMVRPDWRRRYGVAVALLGLVALAFTILTAGAGEAFRESRSIFASPALNEHAELGDQLKAVMVVFVGAIVALVWVVRTGHEGAEVAWSQPSPLHSQSQQPAKP